ncbi:TYRO protein tyrosine kinase-binding protein [Catharus ustulatus]|uniref:TYRO protein tyrosine kinase-binding protein n=1 Tax=Catharus ustulatus TaxID=91951 RepID=UPI00140D6E46|nr:TYRO protein tyrosine kinase-binding protein [Catharus ustulatus]
MGGACWEGAWLQQGTPNWEVLGGSHELWEGSRGRPIRRRGQKGAWPEVPHPGHSRCPSPTAAMGPPGTLGLLLLLLGAAAAQQECSGCLPGPGPIAALVVADVIMTLLIGAGAYWLAGRGRRAPSKPRPPEQDSHYQELQGARADLYSELKR